MKLSMLNVGEKATLSHTNTPHSLFLRLTDMGMSPTSPIECLFCNLSGGMKAYLFGGTLVALRNEDADCIEVIITEV
ncbi:MAG: ferrous iron transport protein A [Clostridia bacterium]|nr:ferrous iron transport protein A [Clostridia bacterium]